MDYALRLGTLLFVSLGCMAFAWQFNKEQTPQIRELTVVGSPVAKFGHVVAGGLVEHEFTVRNITGVSVRIRTVQSSCGCLVAANGLVGLTLSPDDIFKVPVALNTLGKSGDVAGVIRLVCDYGKMVNKGDVDSRSADYEAWTDVLTLRIEGFVKNPLQVEPEIIDFGVVGEIAGQVREVIVRRADEGVAEDLIFEVTGDRYSIGDIIACPEAGVSRIQVRYAPSKHNVGESDFGSLKISLEGHTAGIVARNVPLKARSVADIRVLPEQFVLRKGTKSSIELLVSAEIDATIERIVLSDELEGYLSCVEFTKVGSKYIRVELETVDSSSAAVVSGEITVMFSTVRGGASVVVRALVAL